MKCFMVLALFVALASGDVSHLGSQYSTTPTPTGSSINTAVDTKFTHDVKSALTQGIDTGLSHGTHSGLSQGINGGLSQGINTGLSQGIKTGLSHGINTGYAKSIDLGYTGASNGFGFDGLSGFDYQTTGLGSGFGSGLGSSLGSGLGSGLDFQTTGLGSGLDYTTTGLGSGLDYTTTGLGSGLAYDSGIYGLNYQYPQPLSGLSSGLLNGYSGFGSSLFQDASNNGFNYGYPGLLSSANAFQTSNNYVQQAQNLQPAQVYKHVYVHSAPEEPKIKKTAPAPILPPPQKHYKIIFIKAPTPETPPAPIVPVLPQNEEKTIVYVLSKTPEEQAPVVVPQIPPTAPSKPEVIFIKYDAKKDSAEGLQNTINEYVNSHPGLLGAQETITSSVINAAGGDSLFGTSALTDVEQLSSDIGVPGVTVNSASLDKSFSSAVAANEIESKYVSSNIVSPTQGLPHSTYGTPEFRP